MPTRKLSQLPVSPARDLLMDAEKRGVKILGPELTGYLDWTAIILMGLADIILEMKSPTVATQHEGVTNEDG